MPTTTSIYHVYSVPGIVQSTVCTSFLISSSNNPMRVALLEGGLKVTCCSWARSLLHMGPHPKWYMRVTSFHMWLISETRAAKGSPSPYTLEMLWLLVPSAVCPADPLLHSPVSRHPPLTDHTGPRDQSTPLVGGFQTILCMDRFRNISNQDPEGLVGSRGRVRGKS